MHRRSVVRRCVCVCVCVRCVRADLSACVATGIHVRYQRVVLKGEANERSQSVDTEARVGVRRRTRSRNVAEWKNALLFFDRQFGEAPAARRGRGCRRAPSSPRRAAPRGAASTCTRRSSTTTSKFRSSSRASRTLRRPAEADPADALPTAETSARRRSCAPSWHALPSRSPLHLMLSPRSPLRSRLRRASFTAPGYAPCLLARMRCADRVRLCGLIAAITELQALHHRRTDLPRPCGAFSNDLLM